MLGLAVAGLVAAGAKTVGGVVASWAEARVAGEVGAELRLEVLDDIHGDTSFLRLRHADHAKAQIASLRSGRSTEDDRVGARIADLASLTTHVTEVEQGVAHGVFAEMRAALQLSPLVVLLALLAPRLAGSAALALGCFAVLVLYARRALKIRHARAARESDALLGAADEAVRHADLWATYGAEGRIRAHVASLGRAMVATSARLRARSALLSGTSEVLGALALVLTLALVSAGTLGGVEPGAVVPFAIAFFMAYKPLRELVEGRLVRARGEEALRAREAAWSCQSVSRLLPRSTPAALRAREPWALEALVIDGLVGAYGAHVPLSLRLEPGQLAALVGPTGIGKTSLLRALVGLDGARSGTITWGEQDLTHRHVGPAERPFAWVPQEAPVLGDTLVANVLLGRAEHAEGEVRARDRDAAARLLDELGAHGLVASVGDAILGTERPVSGGERQWIAVARAFATGLPVLLLDEPTSSLDSESQRAMLRAIEGLRGKRTVVLVTHRTEPLAIADVVVRLTALDASRGENADDGASRHPDTSGPEELAVEHVGIAALAEIEVEGSRQGIDVPGAE